MDEAKLRPGFPGERSQAAAEKLRALRERANQTIEEHRRRLGEIETQLSERVRQLAEEIAGVTASEHDAMLALEAVEDPRDRKLAELQRQVEEGRAKHEKFVEQLKAARAQLNALQSQPCAACSERADELTDVKSKLSAAEGEVGRLTSELATIAAQKAEDQARHEKFNEQLAAARKAISELQAASGERTAEHAAQLELYRLEKQELTSQLAAAHAELQSMQSDFGELLERMTNLEQDLAASNSGAASAQGEIESLREMLTAAEQQAKHDRESKERLERQIAELTGLLESADSAQTAAGAEALAVHAELALRDEELNHCRAELAEHREELKAAKKKLVTSDESIASLKEELRACEKAITQCRADLEHRDELQSRLQAELKSNEQLLSQREAELIARDEKISRFKADLKAGSEALAACQAELRERDKALADRAAELRDRADDAARGNDELATRDEELARCKAELETRDAELSHSKEELADRESELSRCTAELAQHRAECDLLRSKGEELGRRLELAEAAREAEGEQRRQAEAVRDELDQLQHKFDLALADVQKLKRENSGLREELASRPEPGDAESPELIALRSQCEELAAKLAVAEAAAAEAAAAPEPSDLERRFEMAVDDVRQLKLENADLREKLAAAANRPKSSTGAGADATDWASQKARLLAMLEEEDHGGPPSVERASERATIEGTIAATDRVIHEKDRQIADLQAIVDGKASESAASEEQHNRQAILDGDEVVAAERKRLAQLMSEWEEKLRASELEFSLERAKLAREQAALKERAIELQMTQDQGPPAATGSGERPRRRWLSALGLADDADPPAGK